MPRIYSLNRKLSSAHEKANGSDRTGSNLSFSLFKETTGVYKEISRWTIIILSLKALSAIGTLISSFATISTQYTDHSGDSVAFGKDLLEYSSTIFALGTGPLSRTSWDFGPRLHHESGNGTLNQVR